MGLSAVRDLFCGELGYTPVDEPLSIHEWPQSLKREVSGTPILLAWCDSPEGSFDILYARLAQDRHVWPSSLRLSIERSVVQQLVKGHPHALVILSDHAANWWHLVNISSRGQDGSHRVLRRIIVGPHDRLRGAAERVALLDLSLGQSLDQDLSPASIQKQHDYAFDVKAVNHSFQQDLLQALFTFEQDLRPRSDPATGGAGPALQLLTCLTFLYFLQRRLWLGQDPRFLNHLWQDYRQSGSGPDVFVGQWLELLVTEGLSGRFRANSPDRRRLPPALQRALASVNPVCLGLLGQGPVERASRAGISDDAFLQLEQSAPEIRPSQYIGRKLAQGAVARPSQELGLDLRKQLLEVVTRQDWF